MAKIIPDVSTSSNDCVGTMSDGHEQQQVGARPSENSAREADSSASRYPAYSPAGQRRISAFEFEEFFDETPNMTGVQWQWLHTRGWIDYAQRENERIERAYQRGDQKVRIKSGKDGKTPMMVFFLDDPMQQFDPVTGNAREVRRIGPSGLVHKFCLEAKRMLQAWLTGHTKSELFSKFKQKREALYKNIAKPEYNVVDFYHETGCCARIARSGTFFAVCMVAVAFNVIWIAIEVDAETKTHEEARKFSIVDHVLCSLFTAELLIRFGAFRKKADCLRDVWFRLDALLVCMMAVETWLPPLLVLIVGSSTTTPTSLRQFSMLRMLRLSRLARVSRLLHQCPELVTLIKGIAEACRSVLFTIVLLIIKLYVAAVVCRTMVQNDDGDFEEQYFSNMPRTMLTLLMHCTFLDEITGLMNDTLKEHGFVMAVFLLFVIFMCSFTVLNMLIGISCEVITNVSRQEKEEAEVSYLKLNLLKLMDTYDAEDNQRLGRNEFNLLMHSPDVVYVLHKFGTDPKALLSLEEALFEEDDEPWRCLTETRAPNDSMECQNSEIKRASISFETFMKLVCRLRGSNPAHVTDIMELREYIRQCVKHLEAKILSMENVRGTRRTLFREDSLLPQGDTANSSRSLLPFLGRNESPESPAPEKKSCVSTILVELNLAGEKSLHCHPSALMIGELLEQLSEEYGTVKVMDVHGKQLGSKLRLCDVPQGSDLDAWSGAQQDKVLKLTVIPFEPHVRRGSMSVSRYEPVDSCSLPFVASQYQAPLPPPPPPPPSEPPPPIDESTDASQINLAYSNPFVCGSLQLQASVFNGGGISSTPRYAIISVLQDLLESVGVEPSKRNTISQAVAELLEQLSVQAADAVIEKNDRKLETRLKEITSEIDARCDSKINQIEFKNCKHLPYAANH